MNLSGDHRKRRVLGQHIVLYAHSNLEAELLALKHQRQLTDGVEP